MPAPRCSSCLKSANMIQKTVSMPGPGPGKWGLGQPSPKRVPVAAAEARALAPIQLLQVDAGSQGLGLANARDGWRALLALRALRALLALRVLLAAGSCDEARPLRHNVMGRGQP